MTNVLKLVCPYLLNTAVAFTSLVWLFDAKGECVAFNLAACLGSSVHCCSRQ